MKNSLLACCFSYHLFRVCEKAFVSFLLLMEAFDIFCSYANKKCLNVHEGPVKNVEYDESDRKNKS